MQVDGTAARNRTFKFKVTPQTLTLTIEMHEPADSREGITISTKLKKKRNRNCNLKGPDMTALKGQTTFIPRRSRAQCHASPTASHQWAVLSGSFEKNCEFDVHANKSWKPSERPTCVRPHRRRSEQPKLVFFIVCPNTPLCRPTSNTIRFQSAGPPVCSPPHVLA